MDVNNQIDHGEHVQFDEHNDSDHFAQIKQMTKINLDHKDVMEANERLFVYGKVMSKMMW